MFTIYNYCTLVIMIFIFSLSIIFTIVKLIFTITNVENPLRMVIQNVIKTAWIQNIVLPNVLHSSEMENVYIKKKEVFLRTELSSPK